MKTFLIIALLLVYINVCYCVLTEAQIKSTAKLMRNACQPKTKVTNEEIDNMHKGVWNGDRNAMCYMLCVLRMMRIMDEEGNFDRDALFKQITTLPEPRRVPTNTSLNNCDKNIHGADVCETAYLNAKCVYEDNPSNYFLP